MQRALEGLEGVESVEMRFDEREFDVVHRSTVTTAKIIEVVESAGFEASMVSEVASDQQD